MVLPPTKGLRFKSEISCSSFSRQRRLSCSSLALINSSRFLKFNNGESFVQSFDGDGARFFGQAMLNSSIVDAQEPVAVFLRSMIEFVELLRPILFTGSAGTIKPKCRKNAEQPPDL